MPGYCHLEKLFNKCADTENIMKAVELSPAV